MEYKVVPFIASIANNGTANHAAEQLEQLIRQHAAQGWNYVRLEKVTTTVAGNNGCFGFGATPTTNNAVSSVDGRFSEARLGFASATTHLNVLANMASALPTCLLISG